MSTTDAPEGLLDAFWAYEAALMANDLPELDRLFAPGADTLRGDAGGLLVGHDAISAFRVGRGGAPARTIASLEVRSISADAALVVAITAPATGGRGQQTQLWRRLATGWAVEVAHVSLPAAAIVPSVWRMIGSPLVAGATTGPLSGERIAVKDLFSLEGHRVGGGVPAYLASVEPATVTAPSVAVLLAAGAAVQGIAQTDEFAFSIAGRNPHYGTPPNGAVPGAIPGGSSSGPATAVALGQATIGLGTDTGGSIRVPASYQGLWGLRTTHGAVSVEGLLPLAPTFDTVGWMTRDLATLRAVATVTLSPSTVTGSDYVWDPGMLALVDPAVATAFTAAIAPLGATEVALGDLGDLLEIYRTVQGAEAWRTHGEWITAHPGSLGADIAARFEWASTLTAADEAAARQALAAARDRLDTALGDRVLLLPSASSAAPSTTADAAQIERTRVGTMRLTCIAGLTGRPGLSIPLLTVPAPTTANAPVGLCLVGPRFADLALLDRGAALVAAAAASAR